MCFVFLSNYRGLRLHAWHILTSVEDQQRAHNHISDADLYFMVHYTLKKKVQFLCLGQFLSNYKGQRLLTESSEVYLMLTFISWSSDFTSYLGLYFMDLHHISDICSE